ncbi:MAG: hypothetical protein ACR2QC_02450 [Gammaproteobacteria bacterium]
MSVLGDINQAAVERAKNEGKSESAQFAAGAGEVRVRVINAILSCDMGELSPFEKVRDCVDAAIEGGQ